MSRTFDHQSPPLAQSCCHAAYPLLELLSDTELARVELDAQLARTRHERAISTRFDQAQAARRGGSERLADMDVLLPLYDASEAARQTLAVIRAERVRRLG